MKHIGGIVLAGGKSRRMGMSKALLPFGQEVVLQRIVRIVGRLASDVVVVAAQGQPLPELPPSVLIARDTNPDCGPLEGIAAGLRCLQTAQLKIESALITACDVPLLVPAFLNRIIELLDSQHDAVVPIWEHVPQPLAGAYRPKILPVVDAMLAENQLRVCDLLDRIRTRLIPAEQLREVDPDLHSLWNLNTRSKYAAALAAAGLSINR
ncbi:MAG TPA: molybdenum cofactor guanylyltransferase [Pirellulales bacterium]|jgi:molybdopterin-guanine dinucleotide biosynthesis protein A|nr:molybdenum cofactor guanylyltransferase [Pirellulales bacterium]